MDPFTREVTIGAAFLAGLLSFLSPCILPIIPSYMVYITGSSSSSAIDTLPMAASRKRTLLNALLFIMGFSIVFISLGATATSLGQLLSVHQELFRKIGGIVVILLGIHMTGLIQLKPLLYEKRIHFKHRPVGYFGALLIGFAFAAGWTPCIGPILGSILALAGTQTSVGSGVLLLAMYSLGLAVPFFLTALLMEGVFVYFRKIQKYMRAISIGSGAFLVLIGMMIYSNMLQTIANYLLVI